MTVLALARSGFPNAEPWFQFPPLDGYAIRCLGLNFLAGYSKKYCSFSSALSTLKSILGSFLNTMLFLVSHISHNIWANVVDQGSFNLISHLLELRLASRHSTQSVFQAWLNM